jgi:DNA-binding protein H-NS
MTQNRFELASMSVDALLKLRDELASLLSRKAGELKRQLHRLQADDAKKKNAPRLQARTSRKILPKYRGPGGETWAGRGLRPKWLNSLIKDGHKLEEFAVEKAAASTKKKRRKSSQRKKSVSAPRVNRKPEVTLEAQA